MKKNLLFIIFVFLFYGVGVIPSLASSPSLWLPISYQSHEKRLLEAAEKVSNIEECNQLLNGTLDERQSSTSHIIFTFRCRSETREVFIVNVDSKSLSVTNMKEVWRKKAIEEEEKRKQEKLRKKLAERHQYWAVCEKTLKNRIKSYNTPTIKTSLPPRPDITPDSTFIYLIEFHALSTKKSVLSYLATAVISSLDSCKIEIRPIL